MGKLLLCAFLLVISFGFSCALGLIGDLHQGEEYKKEAGKKFEAERHSEKGEKGEKGYESQHAVEQGEKGHHDKERQQKHYAEAGGATTAHKHNDGYYDENNRSAKGQQGYHYADKGSYAKGHDTKGSHNVHKLNEFKKRTDFFDEDHDHAFKENHGGFEEAKDESSGAAQKAGEGKLVYFRGKYGKFANFDKGDRYYNDQGFDKARGKDSYFDQGAEYAKEVESEAMRKFKELNSDH